MKVGTKIKTKPTVYEIEILELNGDVPKEQEADFIEWLSSQPDNCSCGINYEYYAYSENYEDDIGVRFDIYTLTTK